MELAKISPCSGKSTVMNRYKANLAMLNCWKGTFRNVVKNYKLIKSVKLLQFSNFYFILCPHDQSHLPPPSVGCQGGLCTSFLPPFQHPTPWLKIFTSPAVWAIVIAHTCSNWGFYTLLTCMPTYFAQALPELKLSTEVSRCLERRLDRVIK